MVTLSKASARTVSPRFSCSATELVRTEQLAVGSQPKPPVPPMSLALHHHGELARDPIFAQQQVHTDSMTAPQTHMLPSLPFSLGQNLVEEILRLALLLQVGLRPLLHQLLQVVGILLHA